MVINRRYKRDLKNNLSLYISATFLTVLSLLLFYLYFIAGTGINNYCQDFFNSQKVEDAFFTTYAKIPENKLRDYEERFDLVIESQEYKNIHTDKVTARVFEKTEKIDIVKVVEGHYPSQADEVIISEGFAQNNGVNIGDNIQIGNKNYVVSGYALRPDYMYMLENLTDTEKNNSTFFICYFSDSEFDSVSEKNCQYLVRFNDRNSMEFRKEVNAEYILSSYVNKEDNFRISMMDDQPQLFVSMSYIVLVTLPLVAVVLISIILSRKIRNEQKMIGTLTAYGYTKSRIIAHYSGFSAIPGIVGGILTTILVYIFKDKYGALGLMDYEPLKINFSLGWFQMLLGVLVPTLMYILSTVLTVSVLLKHDTISLLEGSVKGHNKTRKILVKSNVPIRTKFTLRSMIGSPGRTISLLLGALLGSFVILFGLSCMDSINNLEVVTSSKMNGYNYQYILSTLYDENNFGGETLLGGNAEDDDGKIISVCGGDNNSLLNISDMKGNRISLDNKYYLTSLYALTNGIDKGDKINIINPLSGEEHEIEISGIINDDFSKTVYTSRHNASKIIGIPENYFNMILSEEELSIPEDKLATTMSKDTIAEQYKTIKEQMSTVIYLFLLIGVALCVIAVYISVNMVVTENQSNISMLRVLGYSNNKINRMIIDDNIIVVILAMILSVPVTHLCGSALFDSFIGLIGYRISVIIKPISYIISFLLVFAGYFISTFMLERKISKVDMVESLKDNRE